MKGYELLVAALQRTLMILVDLLALASCQKRSFKGICHLKGGNGRQPSDDGEKCGASKEEWMPESKGALGTGRRVRSHDDSIGRDSGRDCDRDAHEKQDAW